MSTGSITLDVIRKCLVVFKTFFQDLSGVTKENQEKILDILHIGRDSNLISPLLWAEVLLFDNAVIIFNCHCPNLPVLCGKYKDPYRALQRLEPVFSCTVFVI